MAPAHKLLAILIAAGCMFGCASTQTIEARIHNKDWIIHVPDAVNDDDRRYVTRSSVGVVAGHPTEGEGGFAATCSGVLLDATRVLTAAHCVQGRMERVFSLASFQTFGIKKKAVHPEYREGQSAHDVAIACLSAPAHSTAIPVQRLGRFERYADAQDRTQAKVELRAHVATLSGSCSDYVPGTRECGLMSGAALFEERGFIVTAFSSPSSPGWSGTGLFSVAENPPRLIGIITSGMQGSRIGFAIPTAALTEWLDSVNCD